MDTGKHSSVKIGLFGAGYFGTLHARNLLQSPFQLCGFYDPDDEKSKKLIEETGLKRFTSPDDLIEAVDAVDIVTATPSHMELALAAISKDKHIFIEKPIASSAEEAREFIDRSLKSRVKVQVGHIERHNPVFKEAQKYIIHPKWISASRLAPYNPRANDVSVVHDLMIHDIDAILALVGVPVVKIQASGISVLTSYLDMCEARLEFENGCIANIVASRMHAEQERKTSVLMDHKLVQMDYMLKKCKVFTREVVNNHEGFDQKMDWNTPRGNFPLYEKEMIFSVTNAILDELKQFYNSIVNDGPIGVDQHDAFQALLLADKIDEIACRVADC